MNELYSFPRGSESQFGHADNFSSDELKLKTGKLEYICRKFLNTRNISIVLALISVIALLSNLLEYRFLAPMCVFIGVFLIPVFSRTLRQDKYILVGYWFVLFLHQIIAFTNAYLTATVGAGIDATGYQANGEYFAKHEEWSFSLGQIYAQFLGLVFRWFGITDLLGGQLSILAFSLSSIVMIKIIELLGIVRYKLSSFLAFSTLPTMLFLGSITLRESYQVLFFMLAVFFGLKMHMKGGINTYLIAFVLSASAMGISHRGLALYAFFMIPLFFIWSFRPASRLRNIKKLRLAAFVIVSINLTGFMVLVNMDIAGWGVYANYLSRDWLEAISNMRESAITYYPKRASYGIGLDISSNMMTFYSGLKIYIYYLFAPFPWQVNSFLDIYGTMESILRMILIYFSIKHWRNTIGSKKRLLGLMLILFFSITFLYAIGTTNYGTAMRHHMLDWWIIVIIGIPPLMTKLSKFYFGMGIFKRTRSFKSIQATS